MAIRDAINNLPAYQRWAVLVIILILYVAAFVWFIFLPKQEELVKLKQEIDGLKIEVAANQEKANRLEALLQEKASADQQLAALQRELPAEAEAVALLKQIAELGVKSGLDFRLWRPTAPRPAPSGLYVEHPVDVEIAGGYHAVASFLDQISRLQRIVNVTNLKMGQAKPTQTDTVIQTSFIATAFASAQSAQPPSAPPSS
ncbi:MAG: type 4a pilus biogenesis protein PilO [Nitrospirota bacterium]